MTENPKEWQWRFYNALDDFARELDWCAHMAELGYDEKEDDYTDMVVLRQLLIKYGAANIGEYKDTGE
jgi:hypothetical protein